MKRTLLFFCILLSLSQAKASDTLTVRQVFNFNVGDTFDYQYLEYISFPQGVAGGGTVLANHNCYRSYVQQKFFSSDSNTLFYIICTLPAGYFSCDTVRYTSLDSSIITYDTILNPPDSLHAYTFYYASDTENYSQYTPRGGGYGGNSYEVGLGQTYSGLTSGNYGNPYSPAGGSQSTTSLVYYHKGSVHWGTPCYILLGDENINPNLAIHLYPNPTSDQIHLSFTDASQYNTQLILTDILGQQVYSTPITQNESAHDISKLSQGMYNWRLITNNSILRCGKIVKE